MTETADDARTTTTGKRRSPKPRRRPQSRNPSTPMTATGTEAEATPAPGRRARTGKRRKPAPELRTPREPDAASPPPEPAEARPSAGDTEPDPAGEAAEARPAPEDTEPDPAAEAVEARPALEDAHGAAPVPGGLRGSPARGSGGSPPGSGRGGDGEESRPTPACSEERPEPAPGPAAPAEPPAPDSPKRARGRRAAAVVTAAVTATVTAAAAARRALARTAHHLRPSRRPHLPPWWPAVLCVLVGVLAGLGYGLLRPAQYTATSYVAVVPGEEGDPMTALGFAQAYGRIATDTAVLAGAQEESGVPVATLRGSVEAVTSPDAPMIEITGHAARAGEAADVANAVARSLTEVADDSAAATGVELTAFSRARAPREPSTPSPVLTTAVGGSAGVLVGALVLLVRPRRQERSARSTVPAPAGEQPADPEREAGLRRSEAGVQGPEREKEAV